MQSPINRRDFLKLSSLLPLLFLPLPQNKLQHSSLYQSSTHPNVLVFVFDALSAQHLPVYGYPRNTTPNLTRFAERATVYHSHHSGGNFTTPGTASLLTGVYPWTHRAINLNGTTLESYYDKTIFSIFPNNGFTYAFTHNLVAELLLAKFRSNIDLLKLPRELSIIDNEYSDRFLFSDYDVAFTSESYTLRGRGTKPISLIGSLVYGLSRYFHAKTITSEYRTQFPRGVPNANDVFFILEDVTNWLISELPAARKPSLGYIHVLAPHAPYYPRKDFIGRFQDNFKPIPKPRSPFSEGYSEEFLNKQRMEYDEYLAYADSEFGRLYDDMAQKGILKNTVVIVTADHGEMFERGILQHGTPTLYEPIIHIPLLITIPGQTQHQDIYSSTSCVDILPTLAKLTDQPVPVWSEGQILPGFRNDPVQNARSIFSVEAKSSPKFGDLNKLSVSLIKENYKLIYYRGYSTVSDPELYNLSDDPEELHNLVKTKPGIAAELQHEIEARLQQKNSLP